MTQAVTEGEELSTDEPTNEHEHEETDLAEAGDETEGDGGEEGDEGGVTVTIGEETPTSEEDENRAPPWVRELRKSNREKDRRIRELEQERATTTQSQAAVVVGAKPTLEGCDYDAERFENDLEAWHERKRSADAEESKKREAQTKAQAAWQAKLDAYGKASAELKVKDFADAEDVAKDTFSVTQQGVILSGADNPAVVIYALGKNPKKAKELASIEDPVKFAFAVAKLETQMKVTPRKTAPLPESTVRGSAPGMGAMDSNLKRLEAEAEKTGDRSKVVAYKKQLKQKAAA